MVSPTFGAMPSKNTRDVTPDDFDDLDVPQFHGQNGGPNSGQNQNPAKNLARPGAGRGGKPAGPTEVLHVTPGAEPALETVTTQAPEPVSETVALDREPAYIAPAEPEYIAPAEPVYEAPELVTEEVVSEADHRRGTIDLGLLLLRLCFGGYLIIASLETFFQLGNSSGISGLESDYASYPFGNGLAVIVPTLELAAGVFLVLGLITPVAAAVALVVTAFNALHAVVAAGTDWNVLRWDETIWLPAILFGIAVVLQFTGPGYYGVDGGRSWARRPLASSWIWVLVGLAVAGVMWWLGTEVNPFVA